MYLTVADEIKEQSVVRALEASTLWGPEFVNMANFNIVTWAFSLVLAPKSWGPCSRPIYFCKEK